VQWCRQRMGRCTGADGAVQKRGTEA